MPNATVLQKPRVYVHASCCRRYYRRWTHVGAPWAVGLDGCLHCQRPLSWRGTDGQPVDLEIPGRSEDVSTGRVRRDPSRAPRRSGHPEAAPKLTQIEQLEQRASALRADLATADVVRQCLIERDLRLIQEQLIALR